jgi:hypothetical protein
MTAANPAAIVQHQLDAYNAHDLSRYLEVYADDVEVFRPPQAEPSMSGKAALGEFYGKQRFNLPDLRADLVNRIVVGNKVVDHERVFGIQEQPFEVAVTYEIVQGLIRRVWFFSAG